MPKTFFFSFAITAIFFLGAFNLEAQDSSELELERELEQQNRDLQQKVKQLEALSASDKLKASGTDQYKLVTLEEKTRAFLAPFKAINDRDIKKSLKTFKKETPQMRFLPLEGKMIDRSIKVLKDPEALPKLASIIDQKKKLIYFLVFIVGTFIFGGIMKSMQKSKIITFFDGVKYFVVRVVVLYVIRVAGIVYFFHKEGARFVRLMFF
jgi:hypothetical protein